ncbi:MAG: tetratricopeptide repeat protein [Flavipsychrobacter sp.]|nr:tetratricopeptide repeat protein [Flavipsychrobacter sp.]
MAKTKNKQAGTSNTAENKPPQPAKQQAVANATPIDIKQPKVQALIVACIAAITWLAYQVCLNNKFTNWDDPGYIKDNALIKDVSSEGIHNIFSTAIMGNYHPITILTYAIEYSYVRLQPWLYHLDSLLFHILVTLLVYWFVNLLTKRPVAAAVAALLFGLHPMHVESVAWLAGRKDVVYGTFYMAACITYIYYLRAMGAKKTGLYAGVVVLFLCSLLSKPVAVVLPITLLLLDYFEGRKLNMWVALDKLLLLGMSIWCGLRSLKDQASFGSLGTQNVTHNFIERTCLGGYALITYLWKAVVPVGLCNFYPYPDKVNGSLPFVYYLYPLAAIILVFLVWFFARKNKIVVFGTLFFFVNIVLLLQFIPVGGAILADRYTYISYLGLFFMAGWFVSDYFELGGKKEFRQAVSAVVVVYSLVLGYMTYERSQVWYDTTSLWRDEIEKEPVRAPNAYNNLGFNYFNKFNDEVNPEMRKLYYDSAYQLLSKAIELQPGFANPYISLGELERSVGHFALAKIRYYTAISLQNSFENANAYLGLGIIYAISHNFDSSNYCFSMAIKLKPYFPEGHSNYGNFYDMTGHQEEALKEYAMAIAQNPDMTAPYLNRARTLQRLHRCGEAMKDFNTALELSPGMGEIYYARSYCYTEDGKKGAALQDVEKAISLGYARIDNNYYNMLKSSAR